MTRKKRKPVKQPENSAKHLIKYQFQPGESGNPDGRPPKVRTISDILGKIGLEEINEEAINTMKNFFPNVRLDDTMSYMEAVLRMAFIYALQGKPWAIQFIAERTEGKVTQPIDVNAYQGVQLEELQNLSLEELLEIAFKKN